MTHKDLKHAVHPKQITLHNQGGDFRLVDCIHGSIITVSIVLVICVMIVISFAADRCTADDLLQQTDAVLELIIVVVSKSLLMDLTSTTNTLLYITISLAMNA